MWKTTKYKFTISILLFTAFLYRMLCPIRFSVAVLLFSIFLTLQHPNVCASTRLFLLCNIIRMTYDKISCFHNMYNVHCMCTLYMYTIFGKVYTGCSRPMKSLKYIHIRTCVQSKLGVLFY